MGAVKPFDGHRFRNDAFFRQADASASGFVDVLRAGDTVAKNMPCISRSGLDPARDGALMQRAGQWQQITIFVFDFEAAYGVGEVPTAHSTYTVDGTDFDGDSYQRQSDRFVIKAIGNQRKQAHR